MQLKPREGVIIVKVAGMAATVSFRASVEDLKRFEYAEKVLGESRSSMCRELVKRHLRPLVQELKARKSRTLIEALEADVP